MDSRIETLVRAVSEAEGRKHWLEERTETLAEQVRNLRSQLRYHRAALNIIHSVGEELQNRVALRLSSIASHVLASVFPDPYEVRVEFSPSARGGIDAGIVFQRGGNTFKPVLPSGQLLAGGGPVETAAFGLRVSLWAQGSRTLRPILFLDEPFRFLQKDLHPVVLQVMEEVSQKLGLQFIFVTHETELENCNVVEV
jgi:hypothetical protein